ncbi:MAG: hypothetical protein EOM61_09380 [Bacteroidia bacterium]|nr:hypothetical protein [Bacteroidia bacterium]
MKSITYSKISLPLMKTIIVSLVLFVIAGCNANKEDEKAIRFGFIGPLTGPAASYGNAQMKGIKLAVEEINKAGGISGKNLVVIYEDSQMDPNKATSAIKKLIGIDRVTAVIGATTTACTLAIADTANTNKMVLLSPSASGAKVTDAGDYVFRVSPSDTFQAVVTADFVHKQGLKKGAIVFTNDEWGSGLKNAFEKSFTKSGGKIVAAEGLAPGAQDFRTQLVKVKTLNPDFIYIPLYPDESPAFLRQAKEIDVSAQIVGADNFSEKAILNTAGTTANGVIFAMPAESEEKEYTSYLEKFKAKYNEDGSYTSAAGYDCVYLLADAIRQSGADGDKIKRALYGVKAYRGASGLIGFDSNGDVTTKKFSVITIIDGEYKQIK